MFGVQAGEKPAVSLTAYHSGRIFAYSLLGALLAWGGGSVNHFARTPLTHWFLLILLVVYLVGFRLPQKRLRFLPLSSLGQQIAQWLAKFSPRGRALLLGIGSPLLPCGVLYFALAAAAAAPSTWIGMIWMALFAMGTIPLLLLGQIGLRSIGNRLPRRFEWWMQKGAALAAIVFIGWMHLR